MSKSDKKLIDTFTASQRAKVDSVAKLVLHHPIHDPHHSLRELLDELRKSEFLTHRPIDTPNAHLWSRMSSMADSILHAGYLRRLLTDEVSHFTRALFTHARIHYLCHLVHISDPQEPHYLPWFDLIGAVVVGDHKLLDAYTHVGARFAPEPLEPSVTAMFIGLYFARKEEYATYHKRLGDKPWSPPEMYEEMRLSLLAILDADRAEFLTHVRNMAAAHRKQNAMAPFHDGIFRYISIPAHAVFELGRRAFSLAPEQHLSRGFDPLLARSRAAGVQLLEFADVSPVFQSWLEQLPPAIDARELIQSH